MTLHESGEMYLETILELSRKMPAVRSIDIVREMGFSKPSVSNAMKLLRENGYAEVDSNGYITLTEKGLSVAEKIAERHVVLTKMLTSMGVDPVIAAEDACKIEHDISDETFEALKKHFSKYND